MSMLINSIEQMVTNSSPEEAFELGVERGFDNGWRSAKDEFQSEIITLKLMLNMGNDEEEEI